MVLTGLQKRTVYVHGKYKDVPSAESGKVELEGNQRCQSCDLADAEFESSEPAIWLVMFPRRLTDSADW